MGKLVKNHLARLLTLTAAMCESSSLWMLDPARARFVLAHLLLVTRYLLVLLPFC